MKKLKALLLAGYTVALLTGCGDKTLKSVEIIEFPKTTFYCGEDFTNTGITLKVTLNDGTSFETEDVTTSKPTSMMAPGEQKIKAYYTNDKYDINTFVTYDIKVIDWTREEKAIFSETSISSYAGVYYPKMEGMKLLTETDDEGNVIDYWIELENATAADVDTYIDLLNNYHAKKTVNQNGVSMELNYAFYEQRSVPTDFRDFYGTEVHDAIAFKYCASYEYMDQTYFNTYNFYGNEIEDTIVVGLSSENKMIVRYIANSVFMETILSCEVNEHATFSNLYQGEALNFLKQTILGYVDDEGKRYMGALEEIAPLATEDFIMPDVEANVISVANYSSMYPWLHGEDDFCFEIEISSNDEDEYESFLTKLDSNTSFIKTTKQDKVRNHDVNVSVYTIENKAYVGSLVIEVTDFIENGMTYYTYDSDSSQRITVTTGVYRVYYRFQHPEVISPCVDEVLKIYDAIYGEGNHSGEYDAYEDGEIGGIVKFSQFKQTASHPTKGEYEVESKEEAFNLFVEKCLSGYTVKTAASEKTVNGITLYSAEYTNDEFDITIYSYFYGSGKFAVEFSVSIKK